MVLHPSRLNLIFYSIPKKYEYRSRPIVGYIILLTSIFFWNRMSKYFAQFSVFIFLCLFISTYRSRAVSFVIIIIRIPKIDKVDFPFVTDNISQINVPLYIPLDGLLPIVLQPFYKLPRLMDIRFGPNTLI